MGKTLTISVAAYNVKDSLEDTLNSLVSDPETMELMEVLVVDDGSTDGTAGVGEKFAGLYPGTFRLISKENGGYGSTINVSVSEAEGKYFKQLDGGDSYITENLSDFVSFLSKVDADIVISPYEEVFVQDGKTELRDPYSEVHKKVCREAGSLYAPACVLDNGHRIRMHEMAFKTEVWKKLGRNIPEHSFYTDMQYVFYPLVNAATVSFYDKPVYRYFLQCEGQSVSIEGIRKHFSDSEKVMWDLFDVYDNNAGKSPVLQLLVKHSAAFVYTAYIRAGKEHLSELRAIDKKMKRDYPKLYALTDEVKRIKLMRQTGLRWYSIYGHMIGGTV